MSDENSLESKRDVTFGFCLPTFASPGPGLFRVPGWQQIDSAVLLEAAVEADRAGFNSIWIPDHYIIGRNGAVLDGWTTLAVVAGRTRDIRLCLIQQSMLFRHAPQFAKMTATLDQLSGGRLTVFSSFGRAEAEHRAYGFPWLAEIEDRMERFEEGLHILRRMWIEEGPLDHSGTYFALQGAIADPKPVQRPHPPLWFAGTEPQIFALAAEMGNGWNTHPVSLSEFQRQRGLLAEAFSRRGRDIGEITVSLETQILVRHSINEVRAVLRELVASSADDFAVASRPLLTKDDPFLAGRSDSVPEVLTEGYLVGTPEMVCNQMNELVRSGVDCFGLWFLDFPRREGMTIFRDEILPQFSSMSRTAKAGQ